MKLKMIKAGCLSFALGVLAAAPASAQMAWTDRAFANVNFGLQEQSRTVDTSSTFSLYGEDGSMTTSQPIDGGALFDIGWFPQLVSVPGMGTAGLSFVHGPNPSTDGGTLRFRLPQSQRVELSLFDLAGRRVARIADGVMDAGDHAVRWGRTDDRGHKVAAGIYRARLKTGSQEQTLSVVLVD